MVVHVTATRKWLLKSACGKKITYKYGMVVAATAQVYLNRGDDKKFCKKCLVELSLEPVPLVVVVQTRCSRCGEFALLTFGKGGCRKHKQKYLEEVCAWYVYQDQAPRRRRASRRRVRTRRQIT